MGRHVPMLINRCAVFDAVGVGGGMPSLKKRILNQQINDS